LGVSAVAFLAVSVGSFRSLVTVGSLLATARAEEPAAAPPGAPPAVPPAPPVTVPEVVPKAENPPAQSGNAGFVSLSAEGSPIVPAGFNYKTTIYGFAEFDAFHDSTQSFVDASSNVAIARPHTVPGDNGQTQFTPRNSRIGIKLEATPWGDIQAAAQAEMDFYGIQAQPATEGATYTNSIIRMRHYFLTIKDPWIDVLAGQYHDLFAWGGKGFYPNSVAFLALFGEVYHRNPQLRLSHTFRSAAADLEIAVAAVRPVGRVGEIPDGQAGIRVAFNGWRGVRAQGSGPPDTGPLQIGVSGVGRYFRVNPFSQMVGDYMTATGWGVAGNVVIPVVPATATNMRNAVTVTGEVTVGTGIADLYSGLSGGAKYPALPNPMLLLTPPVYSANLDPGILTFDDLGNVHTINWRAFVAGLQYHLPVAAGNRVWVSGVFSGIQSTNLASITPPSVQSTIWTKGYYYDGNLFVAITPAVQADLSYQYMQQTYGDGLIAKNRRIEAALHYFF
jgi:hypothetical protein